MLLPKQLRDATLSFCRVGKNDKRAIDKGFLLPENTHNYLSCELFGKWCMSEGGNYGVLCGFGKLFILDFDDWDTYNTVKDSLPKTFTVLSASKQLPHLYYYATEEEADIKTVVFDKMMKNDKNIPLIGADGKPIYKRILDLQGLGKYCVGPCSRVGDKEYAVDNDLAIATTSYAHICSVLRSNFPFVKVATSKKTLDKLKYKRPKRTRGDDAVRNIKQQVGMSQLLNHYGCDTTQYRCECPLNHSSESKENVDHDSELFYCFNCMSGGDVFSLAMMKEGFDFKESIVWFKETFGVK